MNMKTIMKIMRRRTQMNTRETVTWIPVVTDMIGMMMMIITRAEADVWICDQKAIMKMTTMIIAVREIGKDKEETEAEGMAMTMNIMIVIQEVLIQEEGLVVWVEEWDLGMAAIRVMEMEGVIIIQEGKVVDKAVVVEWDPDMMTALITDTAAGPANFQETITVVVPAIGELGMKITAIGVIQKNSI